MMQNNKTSIRTSLRFVRTIQHQFKGLPIPHQGEFMSCSPCFSIGPYLLACTSLSIRNSIAPFRHIRHPPAHTTAPEHGVPAGWERSPRTFLQASSSTPRHEPSFRKFEAPFRKFEAPFRKFEAPFRKLEASFRKCEAPFPKCEAPFPKCEAPFRKYETSFPKCEAPFWKCKAPFRKCEAPFRKCQPIFPRCHPPFRKDLAFIPLLALSFYPEPSP